MSNKKDIFTVDDYFNLSLKDRARFDEWLKALGANPARTKEVKIDRDNKYVDVTEYTVENDSENYATAKLTGTHVVTYAYNDDPPVWK